MDFSYDSEIQANYLAALGDRDLCRVYSIFDFSVSKFCAFRNGSRACIRTLKR